MSLKTLAVLFIVCAAAGLWSGSTLAGQTPSDVRLWERAAERILVNIDGMQSIAGEYRMSIPLDGGHRRHFQVSFAVEDGFMLNSGDFGGKSHQRGETTVEGSDETIIEEPIVFEHASPGGRGGEIRSRQSGIPYVEAGGDSRLSCSLPHTAAHYFLLNSLIRTHPAALRRVEERSGGIVIFELESRVSGALFELECERDKAYMPRVIRTFSQNPDGGRFERLKSVVTLEHAPVRAPDGSTWYYPVSGRAVSRNGEGESVDYEWQVDVGTLSINRNIPDERFFLQPREDEGLVQARTGTVIRPPKVRYASKPDAGSDPESGVAQAARPQHQPVYSGGWSAWPFVGGLGAGLIVAGLFVFLRLRRAS